ncbi:MAG: outer membrane protein assembly factor BamA [Pseudomonadota bacterium]
MMAAKTIIRALSFTALTALPAATVGGMVLVSTVTVAEAAVVTSIVVRGNQRVGNQTIADFVGFRSGANFTPSVVDDAVKALFRTGLFSDASVRVSGGTLIVEVSEFGLVNQVLFQGNRRLKDDRLAQVVRLAPRERFEQATLDDDVIAIQDAYSRTGRADVLVNASVVDLGENRVNVVFNIEEGGRTKIAQINFLGNNAFSDRRLQGVLSIKRSNLLSWISRNDVFDDQRLAADMEQLRRFYFNRGYADFRVISSEGGVDPDTGAVVINIEVDEGEKYTFGTVEIDSTVTGFDQGQLASAIRTRTGNIYSAEQVEDSLIAMSERLSGNGFPFAEVTPVGNRNFETRTIDVTYVVDQGQRAFIERIEITGNTQTRDYVIRREFDVAEGDAFNQFLVRRAQRRLEALDFFERVQISTRQGSAPDRVIIVVNAVDKPTGEIGGAVGYATGSSSTAAGVNFEASIVQRNFQGRGQRLALSGGGGVDTRTYNLSFTEPYFLGYRMSARFDVFQRRSEIDDSDYNVVTTGGSVSFGLPLNDNLTATSGYSYVQEEYSLQSDGQVCDSSAVPPIETDCAPASVAERFGSPRVKSSINYGLTYNTIDNRNDPRDGLFVRLNQEIAGLGGDARYVQTTADASYYKTLSEEAELVGLVRVGAGNVTGLGGDGVSELDNFRLGASRIRGFAFNGIGPVSNETGDQIGGTTYLNATAEMQFPLPALPRDLGFKGAFFADAATLFGKAPGTDIVPGTDDMNWRASAGVSLIWQSPFAPLRLDYAFPLMKEDTDNEQRFSFSVSSAF